MTFKSINAVKHFSAWLGFWVVSALIVFFYFLNLPLWLDRANDTAHAPTIYALVPLTTIVFAIFFRTRLYQFLKTPYFLWCAFLLLVAGLNYLRLVGFGFPSSDIGVAVDQLERFTLLPCYALLIYLTPKRNFKFLLPVLALLVPSIIIVEFFLPDIFISEKNNPDKARVQGFWGNPNAAAEVVVLSILLSATLLNKSALSIITTVGLLALVFTGSRAGMAMGAILIVLLLIGGRLPKLFLLVPIIVALSMSALVTQIEIMAENSGRYRGVEDLTNRLVYFSEDAEKDFSEEARTDSAIHGLIEAMDKPILGHGVQYRDLVYNVGPHNLVIEMMHEYGIFGIILWVSLAVLLFKSSTHKFHRLKSALVVFIWFSMFNHNLLEYQWWYIFIAISMYHSAAPPIHHSPAFQHKASGQRRRHKKRRRKTPIQAR